MATTVSVPELVAYTVAASRATWTLCGPWMPVSVVATVLAAVSMTVRLFPVSSATQTDPATATGSGDGFGLVAD